MKRRKNNTKDSLDILNILSIISITIVALLLIVLFKVKAGILGIGLALIAVATLIFWLREAKKIFREEGDYLRVKGVIEKKGKGEAFYDLSDDGESMTLTAEVPGPTEEVNVKLHDGVLEIRGGTGFMQRVPVSKEVKIQDWLYNNGVLRVRLQKLRRKGPTEFIDK